MASNFSLSFSVDTDISISLYFQVLFLLGKATPAASEKRRSLRDTSLRFQGRGSYGNTSTGPSNNSGGGGNPSPTPSVSQ